AEVCAGGIAPHHEDGGAGGTARIVRYPADGDEQIGLRPARNERLHPRDDEAVAASRRRGAWSFPRVREGERGGELAAKHGQEESLALRSHGQLQQAAVVPQDAVVENAQRARELLVEGDLAERPQAAAAQLRGLEEPIEP